MSFQSEDQNYENLIIGSWQSDTIGKFSAQLSFYENNKGTIKWSNQKVINFEYLISKDVITFKINRKKHYHKIHKLDLKYLQLKPLGSRKKEIQLIDLFVFIKIDKTHCIQHYP